jgi:hypothetical protein
LLQPKHPGKYFIPLFACFVYFVVFILKKSHPILAFEDLRIVRDGTVILDGVNWHVQPGGSL